MPGPTSLPAIGRRHQADASTPPIFCFQKASHQPLLASYFLPVRLCRCTHRICLTSRPLPRHATINQAVFQQCAASLLSACAGVSTGSLTPLPYLCFSAVRHPEAGSKCKDIGDGELAESL